MLPQIRIPCNIIGKSVFLHTKVMALMKRVSFISLLYTRIISMLLPNFVFLSYIYDSSTIFQVDCLVLISVAHMPTRLFKNACPLMFPTVELF